MFSGLDALIIGGVVIVLFGAESIPKFARSLGQAKKEFEKGMKEGAEEDNKKEEPKTEEAKTEEAKKEETKK
jgi:sec-independent protein translocase protein TatA